MGKGMLAFSLVSRLGDKNYGFKMPKGKESEQTNPEGRVSTRRRGLLQICRAAAFILGSPEGLSCPGAHHLIVGPESDEFLLHQKMSTTDSNSTL